MTPLDLPTTAVLLLAAMLGGALFGLAVAWRGLQAEAGELPIWRVVRRADVSRARDLELRCMACGSQRACHQALDAGRGLPAHCPNEKGVRTLFPHIGTAVSFSEKGPDPF